MPRDSELVILNDGSTDRTLDLIEKIDDARLRVTSVESPIGVSAALNSLLAITDSKYIARMDADDICLPWRFRHQIDEVRNCDFSFTTVGFIDSRSFLMRLEAPVKLTSAATPLHLLLGNALVHPTMFAERDAVFALGGYRDLASEDYDLWLRAAAADFRITRTGVPGLLYRIHEGQLSASTLWRSSSISDELIASFSKLAREKTGESYAFNQSHGWTEAGLYGLLSEYDRQAFRRNIEKASKNLAIFDRLALMKRLDRRFRDLTAKT